MPSPDHQAGVAGGWQSWACGSLPRRRAGIDLALPKGVVVRGVALSLADRGQVWRPDLIRRCAGGVRGGWASAVCAGAWGRGERGGGWSCPPTASAVSPSPSETRRGAARVFRWSPTHGRRCVRRHRARGGSQRGAMPPLAPSGDAGKSPEIRQRACVSGPCRTGVGCAGVGARACEPGLQGATAPPAATGVQRNRGACSAGSPAAHASSTDRRGPAGQACPPHRWPGGEPIARYGVQGWHPRRTTWVGRGVSHGPTKLQVSTCPETPPAAPF